MSPRLRLVALIVAVEMLFAAVFFVVRDSESADEIAADRTTTTGETSTAPSTSALDETNPSLGASTTATAGPTVTTRRGTATSTRQGTQSPGTTAPPGPPDGVVLQRMATLSAPVALAVRLGDPATVYVAEKGGRVRALSVGNGGATVSPGAVLDISTRVSTGSEQGLLGIAFSPDGGRLYANYTDTVGDPRVVEYPFANGAANAGAERLVLAVDQPFANHNGGDLKFGPDGLLYIALGDGGSAGDPQGHGQRLDSHLGKILRIDPRAAGGQAYTVPADNPFVGRSDARPEIWHYGLRNPWRFSFDRGSGDQWIADVGQGQWEEVNHITARRGGVNFGWNRREGAHPYNGGTAPPGAVDPEYELSHSAGNCSITGGFVYRGGGVRGLDGTYVFADHCRGRLLGAVGGSIRELGPSLPSPSSFGEDAAGEMWVLSLDGGVFRVWRNRP